MTQLVSNEMRKQPAQDPAFSREATEGEGVEETSEHPSEEGLPQSSDADQGGTGVAGGEGSTSQGGLQCFDHYCHFDIDLDGFVELG